jgi:hypothetical protein
LRQNLSPYNALDIFGLFAILSSLRHLPALSPSPVNYALAAASWRRAAQLKDDYRAYYDFLGSLGRKVK